MLTQTIDAVLQRFGFLRSKIDEAVTLNALRFLKSLWVRYRGSHNPYIRRLSIAGIDSSFNYIEYRGYALYVVNTVSAVLSEKREEHLDGRAEIDIATTPNIEYELSLLSMATEIDFMKKLASSVDLVLVDGSLVAMFARLHRASLESRLEILEDKGYSVIQVLKDLVYTVGISPRKFLFISKNSNAKDLLGLVKGDVYYLERYTEFSAGYTKPVDLARSKHLGVSSAVNTFRKYVRKYTGLDLSIGLTYVRLEDFARVYRIEMVIEPDEDVESRIRYAINALADIVVSGYPYPLIRAHKLAKVGDKDIRRIAMLLGILKDPMGRESFLM